MNTADASYNPYTAATVQRVTITGLDIPFFDLMWLIVKISLASIPAGLILTAIAFVIVFAAGMLLGALGLIAV